MPGVAATLTRRSRAWARIALVVAVALAGALAAARDATAVQPKFGVPGNLILNPGAEDDLGLVQWEGGGFRQATYGESRAVAPLEFGLASNFRATFFGAQAAGALITQRVDLSRPVYMRLIDAGNVRITYGGAFGGQAGREETAWIVLAPLDETGAPIGPPQIVGGPSNADRRGRTTLLDCTGRFTLPRYVRAMQVTLHATGTADGSSTAAADGLFATMSQYAFAAGPPTATPGCVGPQPALPAVTRPPLIRSVVRIPRRNRCGRPDRIRFRVRNEWSMRVTRIVVRSRGKRATLLGGQLAQAIRIPGPKRRMLVRVTAVLSDGRVSSGRVRFRACGYR